MKHIMLVAAHNAFREALAIRLSREEDMEVAWQAGSIAETTTYTWTGSMLRSSTPYCPTGTGWS